MISAAEDKDLNEKLLAEKLAAEVPKLEGIDSITVHFDEDYTGDPALWLVFKVPPEFMVDRDWVGRFNEYSGEIQTKILHSGLARFPYKRLERTA